MVHFFALYLKEREILNIMGKEIIKLENVSFSYEREKVIDDLSVKFEKGRFYGILGPNGCGKTTLLDIIIRYKISERGNVLINEESIFNYSKEDIAKLVSIVPQDFFINFPFMVEDVINMGRYPFISRFSLPAKVDREIVNRTIKDLKLSDIRYKYVTQLSGGERQRVIFARALVQDTPVLLIDEGTSNLDIKHSIHILNHVKNKIVEEGKTVVAVFHNLNLATLYCDNLVFMKEGSIVASGPTDEIFNKEIINMTFDINCHIYVESYTGRKQIVFK